MATEFERTLRAAVGKVLEKDKPGNVALDEFIDTLSAELKKATECEIDYVSVIPKDTFMQRELNIKIKLSNVRSGLPKTNVVCIEVSVLSDPN